MSAAPGSVACCILTSSGLGATSRRQESRVAMPKTDRFALRSLSPIESRPRVQEFLAVDSISERVCLWPRGFEPGIVDGKLVVWPSVLGLPAGTKAPHTVPFSSSIFSHDVLYGLAPMRYTKFVQRANLLLSLVFRKGARTYLVTHQGTRTPRTRAQSCKADIVTQCSIPHFSL